MRKFEIIREEWPALFKFDGLYFEEDYNIDTNRTKFSQVSAEYVAIRRGIRPDPEEPAVLNDEPIGERMRKIRHDDHRAREQAIIEDIERRWNERFRNHLSETLDIPRELLDSRVERPQARADSDN